MEFADYLNSLERTPLTEALSAAYAAIFEGITPATNELGKYIRGFDGGQKMQAPDDGVMGEYQHYYITLGRKPREVAAVLAAGSKLDGDNVQAAIPEFKSLIEKAGGKDAGKYSEKFASLLAGVEDKEGLADSARLYAAGKTRDGFKKLADTLGGMTGGTMYTFIQCFSHAFPMATSDASNMSLNPDAKKSRVLNRWLVHGTSPTSALKIAAGGFDRGNKVGDLAYNRSQGKDGQKHDYGGDYLFAFDASDELENYTADNYANLDRYGLCSVVFKGSGYKIYHKGDGEYQVIFDYREPTGCFLVMSKYDATEKGLKTRESQRRGDDKYQVYGRGKDGKPFPLVNYHKREDCVRWILKHGDRYSSLMFRWK